MLWRGSAVLAGWYATVIVAVAVWVHSLDDSEPADCSGWGCWSDQAWGFLLTRVAAFWLLPLCILASLVTLTVTAGKLRTGWSAGGLAAVAGLVGGPVLLAVLLSVRILS